MKKTILLIAFVGIFSFGHTHAQQAQPIVNYDGQLIIDTDLDGLTDQSEDQVYYTNSKNPDTDSDGYYDGSEILANSNPNNANSIPGLPETDLSIVTQNEIPWAWYISRASGLVAFTLLYLSIFLGLTIRIPFLRRIFAPLYAMQGHCWISFQATLFVLIHGTVLLFDKFMGFKLIDVFVPFASSYKPGLVALGTIGFYLMVIITVSSYSRKYISQKLWRTLHFANIILYFFVIAHAYFLGTDMKNEIMRNIFVYANVFLILLILVNMFSRIRENIARNMNNNLSS